MNPPHLSVRLSSLTLIAIAALTITAWPAGAEDAAATPASASTGSTPGPIQPLSRCLDPASIRQWDRLDAHEVAVTTRDGEHFGLRFDSGCQAERDKPAAWQMSAQAPSRLCGFEGETAISSAGDMCAIASIERLDKTQFDAMISTGH